MVDHGRSFETFVNARTSMVNERQSTVARGFIMTSQLKSLLGCPVWLLKSEHCADLVEL